MRGDRTSPSPASRAATSRAPSPSPSCGWALTRRDRPAPTARGRPTSRRVVAADPDGRARRRLRRALRPPAALPAQGARARAGDLDPGPPDGRAGRAACGPPPVTRVYVDDWAKPELLLAIAPFEVFVGMRTHAEVATLAARLRRAPAHRRSSSGPPRPPTPRTRCSPASSRPRPTRRPTSPARSWPPACGSRRRATTSATRARPSCASPRSTPTTSASSCCCSCTTGCSSRGSTSTSRPGCSTPTCAGSASRCSPTPTTSCGPG